MADLESGSADNPWPAFADLLAASTLLFLILFAVVAIPSLRKGVEGERREQALGVIVRNLEINFDSSKAKVTRVGDYVLVTIAEDATFPANRFELEMLKREGKDVLQQFGRTLRAPELMGNIDQIQVVGHTSREGSAKTNWNLSAARAATVALFLIDSVEVNPCQISALGRSKYYPVNPERARAQGTIEPSDRRIELEIHPIVIRDKTQERRRASCVDI